jgi:hypothetical protein
MKILKKDVERIIKLAEENLKLWEEEAEEGGDGACTCGADDGNGGTSGCIIHEGLETAQELLNSLNYKIPPDNYAVIDDAVARALSDSEYNNRPMPEDYLRAKTPEELYAIAKRLREEGFAYVLPADEPRFLTYGFLFENSDYTRHQMVYVKICDVAPNSTLGRPGWPEDVRRSFHSERARLDFCKTLAKPGWEKS